MTPNVSQHYEDWDMFALGVLDEDEQQKMAAHLSSGCEICAPRCRAAQVVVAGLATQVQEEPLAADGEAKLLRRLQFDDIADVRSLPRPTLPAAERPIAPVERPGRRGPRWAAAAPWLLAAASLIAAAGLGERCRNLAQDLRQREQDIADLRAAAGKQATVALPPVPIAAFAQPGPAGPDEAKLRKVIEDLHRQLQTAEETESARALELQSIRTQYEEAEQHLTAVNAQLSATDARLKDADARRAEAEEHLAAVQTQLAGYQAQVSDSQAKLRRVEADARSLQQQSADNNRILSLLQSRSLSQLDLKPVHGARAAARVYWQNDRGLLLVAEDLPPLSSDQSLNLWFYRQGKPNLVHVGKVQVGSEGDGILFVPPGPTLLSMAGALLTIQSASAGESTPGTEILRVKP